MYKIIPPFRCAIEGHAIHFKKAYGSFENSLKKDDGLAVIAFFGKVCISLNFFTSYCSVKENKDLLLKSIIQALTSFQVLIYLL